MLFDVLRTGCFVEFEAFRAHWQLIFVPAQGPQNRPAQKKPNQTKQQTPRTMKYPERPCHLLLIGVRVAAHHLQGPSCKRPRLFVALRGPARCDGSCSFWASSLPPLAEGLFADRHVKPTKPNETRSKTAAQACKTGKTTSFIRKNSNPILFS